MRGARTAFLLAALAAGAPAAPPDADEMVSSTLPSKREEGAALLGQQGDTAAAKKLISMLDDPDWGVQMAEDEGVRGPGCCPRCARRSSPPASRSARPVIRSDMRPS